MDSQRADGYGTTSHGVVGQMVIGGGDSRGVDDHGAGNRC